LEDKWNILRWEYNLQLFKYSKNIITNANIVVHTTESSYIARITDSTIHVTYLDIAFTFYLSVISRIFGILSSILKILKIATT
jgi:hypothetical protein